MLEKNSGKKFRHWAVQNFLIGEQVEFHVGSPQSLGFRVP
jgi:hypothetical protein